MAEQLPLDFSDSAAVRHRRAVKAVTKPDDDQPRLFADAPNLDVHLHSAQEAVAQISGPDPDRAVYWLQQLVGAVKVLKPRRVAFPTDTLDRLLSIRPPAQVTLDASALAVARAIWAAKLGLKPLKVHRDRQRLLASSQRWPSGFGVKDAPWPAIATIEALGLPLDIDVRAQSLMTDKLVKSGSHIASAGLAGTAVLLETTRPDLLERLHLPALAYAGDKQTGRYRMPLLAAGDLLNEPSIAVSGDLAAAIKRATAKVKPLVPPDGFPWTLYQFQARDAARGKRILETTGGVLLAGTMGSGKAQPLTAPILTPTGWATMGELRLGDLVIGADGRPYPVTGIYPQEPRLVYRVRLGDGAEVSTCDEHLWTVTPDGGRTQTLPLRELRRRLQTEPERRMTLPPLSPVAFAHHEVPADPYQLGRFLARRALHGSGQPVSGHELRSLLYRSGHEVDSIAEKAALEALLDTSVGDAADGVGIPFRYLFNAVTIRTGLLQGLCDGAGRVTRAGSVCLYTNSPAVADAVVFLSQSLGGFATTRSGPLSRSPQGSRSRFEVTLRLPATVVPFRDGDQVRRYLRSGRGGQITRWLASAEPAGVEAVQCISVGSPDRLYVAEGFVPLHNTTVSLALAADLDTWPLLVVAPLAAFSTWARQLGEMGRSHYLAKETPAKSWAAIEEGNWDAVVISYDRLHAFVELIERQGYAAIIADELQRIRTPGSRRSRAIRQLAQAVPLRMGLSGTPLTNKLDDLLPLGAFLIPGEWKPRANAKDLEDLYPGDPTEAIADHLGSMMVRRTMEQTGVKLPDRNLHRVMVALTPEQRRALEDLEAEAEAAKESGALENEGKLHAFVRLQRMRQIVADPVGAGIGGRNPKVDAAIDLVEEFVGQGRKGVVFCADRRVWREVGAELDAAGIGWVGIWGATPIQQRIDNEKKFHSDPDTKIVLCTVQAASESVTFSPTATFLVCLSYVYAPSTMDQMEARIYRMNTVEPVEICYLHAKAPGGTLDDRIVEILTLKRELFAKVVDRTTHVDTTKVHYSMGDLVYLLTGSRDENLDAREADSAAVVEREQSKKRHARVTAHAHKGKNRTSDDFYDDGSGTRTLEEWMDAEEVELSALSGDEGGPADDLDEDDFDDA